MDFDFITKTFVRVLAALPLTLTVWFLSVVLGGHVEHLHVGLGAGAHLAPEVVLDGGVEHVTELAVPVPPHAEAEGVALLGALQ